MQSLPVMSRKDLDKQIRELSNELTMATFISRGAIQENRELKSEIDELRKQNTALRTTERRLTTTEDQLEKCQERLRSEEARVRELERLTGELQSRLREWEGTPQDLRRWMEQGQAILNRGMMVDTDKQPGPSRAPSARRSRSRQVVDTAEQEPRHSETRTNLTSAALISELFPDGEQPPRTPRPQQPSEPPATKKKRRRLGEDDEEDTDEPYNPPRHATASAAATAPSRSPLRREKKRPQIQLATIKVERPDSDLDEGSDDEDPLGRY